MLHIFSTSHPSPSRYFSVHIPGGALYVALPTTPAAYRGALLSKAKIDCLVEFGADQCILCLPHTRGCLLLCPRMAILLTMHEKPVEASSASGCGVVPRFFEMMWCSFWRGCSLAVLSRMGE